MQTLISIRRRGWSGRIASLPLSSSLFFLLFVFFAKATGRLKTRRSTQGSAFWGSERCAPKF